MKCKYLALKLFDIGAQMKQNTFFYRDIHMKLSSRENRHIINFYLCYLCRTLFSLPEKKDTAELAQYVSVVQPWTNMTCVSELVAFYIFVDRQTKKISFLIRYSE